MRPGVPALAALLVLAACGVSDDRDQAREAAAGFYDAVERRDGEAACDRLAAPTAQALERQERAPCEEAVVDVELGGGRVTEVEVFETDARVAFARGDVAYVDRRAGGWKVSAAGCRVKPAGPAECELED